MVHASQMKRAVHDRLAHVDRVLRADHDVAELPRNALAEPLSVSPVDRKGEHVGGTVLAEILAAQLRDAYRVDEFDREMTVLHTRGRERERTQALHPAPGKRCREQMRTEYLDLEHRRARQARRSAR